MNTFGQDSAIARVATREGMKAMDSVRTIMSQFAHIETQSLDTFNVELQKKSRIENTVQFTAFTLIGVTSVLALIRLVQERRKSKELLQHLEEANSDLEQKVTERTQKLVIASEAKNHFLGVATHDLKSPTSSMLGIINIMKYEPDLSPSTIEYLKLMEDTCHKMHHLITDLLDLNRIESGAMIVNKEVVNLGRVFERLRKEFEHQAQKKKIQLIIESGDISVTTDAEILYRILENLISNAIKFSDANKAVRVNMTKAHNGVELRVVDEGPGIHPEELPLLFGKFQRLSNRPTGGESTSGLGLSIVKELSTAIGSTISVTSTIGKGTAFLIEIPDVHAG